MTNETKSLVGTIAVFDECQVRCICYVAGQQMHMYLPAGRYVAVREERLTISDLGRTKEFDAIAVRKDAPLGEYETGDHQVYFIHPASLLANKPV